MQKKTVTEEAIASEQISEGREFTKDVDVIIDATHSCSFETFDVLLSENDEVINTLQLVGASRLDNKVEIGNLPAGIDMRFTKNQKYLYTPTFGEKNIKISLWKKKDAKGGNYNVPIMYTQDGVMTLCQMNISL